jgi:hypothetical protein
LVYKRIWEKEKEGKEMKDFSINLPSWAYQLGYRLEGLEGTYDDLYLYKDREVVKRWLWNRTPNIYEMEEVIKEIEYSNPSPSIK